MFVVFDGFIDFSNLVKCESSVEDGFEVQRIELNCAVIVLNSLFEVLFLAGLPAVGMQDVCLFQSIFSGNILLGETSIIKRAIFISAH